MSYITDPGAGHIFLVGNSGGAVYPDAGRFSILGSGVISVAGDPITSTMTITAGSSVATTFTGDTGVATPALNILKIVGGDNINTAASGNTMTINVGGLTPYAVQVGSGANKLHSLSVGTNGQILVGNTGGYPTFYTLGTTNGINSTIGAGTLSIGGITASTSQIGVSLLATDAETIAGTVSDHVIVPTSLKAKLGTQTQYALPVGTGDTAAIGWLSVGGTGEGLMGSTGANPAWTNSPSFGGSVTAATSITATGNDITATAGKIKTTNNSIEIGSTYASNVANDLDFKKSRTGGVITALDELGNITFQGHDGTNYVIGAAIIADTTATIATNRIPTQLQFWTHGDNTTAALQRLTIGTTGEVTIAAPDSGVGLTITAGGETITAGNLTLSSGNLIFPSTTTTTGMIMLNSLNVLHSYGTSNIWLGGSGNLTLTNAAYNVGVGKNSLIALVGTAGGDASYNTSVGYNSMYQATESKGCVALGYNSGSNYTTTESYNIVIGNAGVLADNNTIRIGGGTGSSAGQQNKAYLSGIYGISNGATASTVFVDSSDQLGVVTGTVGQILRMGATKPAYTTATYPDTVAIGDVLVASAANTIGVVTGAATSGYVLMANGTGTAPTFQALPASGISTLAGDSGTATGSTVTIAGGTNITTSATSATVTVDLDNSITLSGDVTALNLKTSTAANNLTIHDNNITSDGSGADIDINLIAKGVGGITFDGIATGYSDSQWHLRQSELQTTDATPTALVTIPLVEGEMITINATINGFQNDFTDACGATCVMTCYRPTGGNVTQVGEEIINVNSTSTAVISADVNVGTQSMVIYAAGVAAETWNWVSTHQYMFTKTNA